MKNDPFFKFVAVIIIAGVFVALLSPNHTLDHGVHAASTAVSAPAAEPTE